MLFFENIKNNTKRHKLKIDTAMYLNKLNLD